MARYVLVEFSRNEDAEAFVKSVNQANKDYRTDRVPFVRRVVGIFVKPGKTCECGDAARINYGDKNQKQGIERGGKFGWWVCTRCGRPRAGGHQLVNQLRMGDTYEGPVFNDYEFCVTDLAVTGIHTSQIERPKRFRRKKVKG